MHHFCLLLMFVQSKKKQSRVIKVEENKRKTQECALLLSHIVHAQVFVCSQALLGTYKENKAVSGPESCITT